MRKTICVRTNVILIFSLIANLTGAFGLAVGSDAASEIAHWATLPSDSSQGRPLPLAGSWMAEGMYGPRRFAEMIEDGHHVLITFLDPTHVARWTIGDQRNGEKRINAKIEEYYRPALEYAYRHKLPIVFRGWNWGDSVGTYQTWRQRWAGEEIPHDKNVRMVENGKPSKLIDPFGPIEGWLDWGAFWTGNEVLRRIQEIYPNPPMVVFLNNNEGPKVRNADQVPDAYPRFLALYGKGPHTRHEKELAIREGYEKRYKAMFDAAREALIEPAWKKNTRFVAYNNLWGTGYIGQSNRPRQGIWFEPDRGWLEWRKYDGGMPELYDNDWQPGKTDYHPWSPQTEAMNYYSVQDRIFKRNSDFYWASIVWEGGRVSDVWRGRRSSSKPYSYITRGQRWDFARYEGWVQFGLWVTRARSFREFRWPPSEKHAYDHGAFMAVLRSVDRPWKHDLLGRFWRFGELVPNPRESHPFTLGADQPQWVKDLRRWYLLTCDANPPRDQWEPDTPLRVFSIALVLGARPQRKWLIYAHAPLGAVADTKIQLPGFGNITLDSVPKSGSFFHVRESDRSITPLITGGPNELSLRPAQDWGSPGEKMRFNADPAHAPNVRFDRFTWSFGDGNTVTQSRLDDMEHVFDQAGQYVVTLRGDIHNGESLVEQTVVHVGEKPEDAIIYDISLDEALVWRGPWSDSGEPDHNLVTYRHLPNRGKAPMPVLSGGRFVQDAQRGRVLELGGDHDCIWLARNIDTVMDRKGHANQTISMWFKAEKITGRQVLFAQGFQGAGFNVYLDGDILYAGSWAPAENMSAEGWYPIWGRDFPGHWLSRQSIKAGRWYHVALVLDGATEQIADGKQKLYVNGKLVNTGPGVRIPRQYAPPRIGRAQIGKSMLTRFHDGGKEAEFFRGRIDDFHFSHNAEAFRPNDLTVGFLIRDGYYCEQPTKVSYGQ